MGPTKLRLITWLNKYITNIKQFGGDMWMQAKTWHKMISFGFKTLHIWIRNIRKGVGIYTPTLWFQFSLGFSNIWRMCFFSKMLMKSTDSNPIHHRYSNNNSMWVHVIIRSQWCDCYGCHIWHKWHEIPSIHLDGIWWSLHECSFSVDHYKYANNWGFDRMVETIKK